MNLSFPVTPLLTDDCLILNTESTEVTQEPFWFLWIFLLELQLAAALLVSVQSCPVVHLMRSNSGLYKLYVIWRLKIFYGRVY